MYRIPRKQLLNEMAELIFNASNDKEWDEFSISFWKDGKRPPCGWPEFAAAKILRLIESNQS